MGDKSPKAKAKAKKQDATKAQHKAAAAQKISEQSQTGLTKKN
jgi:hypothetical protein